MKVLIVDDDVISRMVLMDLIDRCGPFEILEAHDGEHAWRQLEQGLRPLICFCDLRMPRLSGMDLLERVKAHDALNTMPFVMVTSATDSATVDQAAGLGVNGYLVKPFKSDDVHTFMAQFSNAPQAVNESPQASMQRLGIDAGRLLVYLGGFQAQVGAAGADIAALLANGDDGEAHLRIERLHAGCLTLGLYGAAGALSGFPEGRIDSARLALVLADTLDVVMQQAEALKRMRAAA